MSRKLLLVLTLLFALSLTACLGVEQTAVLPTAAATLPPTFEPTAPVTSALELTDGLGRTVKLAGPAQRVVSVAPSNTEILFAVGAGAQVVGRDQFSDYPAAALSLPDLGSGFGGYNTEVLLSLQPDLVLAADITPAEQIKALEDLGLVVYALPNPQDFGGLYENLRRVALLTGHAAEAETLVTALQGRVQAVETALSGVEARPLVFYELDASTDVNAPWTSGPGTFVDLLIHQAGGRNLGAELQGDWAQLSLEILLAQDPELILLGDATYGGVTPEMVAARAGWEGLQAIQNNQVHAFDDNMVSRPGPRMVDGLEAMARLFHPELFK